MGCVCSNEKLNQTETNPQRVEEPQHEDEIENVQLEFDSDCDLSEGDDDQRVLTKKLQLGAYGSLCTYMTLKETETLIEWVVISKTKNNLDLDVEWKMYNLEFEGENIGTRDNPRIQCTVNPLDTVRLGQVRMTEVKAIDFDVSAKWKIGDANLNYLEKLSRMQSEKIKKKVGESKVFFDEEFPATNESLDSSPTADLTAPIEFKMLKELSPVPTEILVEGQIIPTDVVARKNYFFFDSALAVLAEKPIFIQRVFITKTLSRTGKYILRICLDSFWQALFIDQLLPSSLDTNQLVFAHSHSGQLWPALMEKLYAKVLGDYKRIELTTPFHFIEDFTGCPLIRLSERGAIPADFLRDLKRFMREIETESLLIFAFFAYKDNMTLKTGLTTNRLYSVLKLVETERDGTAVTLVQLRNHCSPHFDWKGRWSKDSEEWDEKALADLQPDFTEGKFWMGIDDFSLIFNEFGICFTGCTDELSTKMEIGRSADCETPQIEILRLDVPEGTTVDFFSLAQSWELLKGNAPHEDIAAIVLGENDTIVTVIPPTTRRNGTKMIKLTKGLYDIIPFSSGALLNDSKAGRDHLTITVYWTGEEEPIATKQPADEFRLWTSFNQVVSRQVEQLNIFNKVKRVVAEDSSYSVYSMRLGQMWVGALELSGKLVGSEVEFEVDCSEVEGLLPAGDSFVGREKKVFSLYVEKEDFTVVAKFIEREENGAKFVCKINKL